MVFHAGTGQRYRWVLSTTRSRAFPVFPVNVVVEQNSHVEQSIVFDDVIIEPNVNIRYTIIDKQARVQAGASIGYDSNLDTQRGCFISDSGIVVVPKGMDIAPA